MSNIFSIIELDNNYIDNNNDSYYIETVRTLIKYNEEYNNNTKLLYKSILESNGNLEVLNEDFSKFFNKVKEIFKAIIDFIIKLFDKLLSYISDQLNLTSYFKVRVKRIRDKFTDRNTFSYTGYNFIDSLYSTTKPEVKLSNSMVELTDNLIPGLDSGILYKSKYVMNKKELDNIIKEEKSQLSRYLNYTFFDRVRGELLDQDIYYVVPEDTFKEECEYYFRNQSAYPLDLDIDKAAVFKYTKYVEDYSKIKKNIEDEKVRFDRVAKKAIKDVESNAKAVLDNNFYTRNKIAIDDTIKTDFNSYVRLITDAMNKVLNIYSIFISSKLDAARDLYTQSLDICKEALIRIS